MIYPLPLALRIHSTAVFVVNMLVSLNSGDTACPYAQKPSHS
jgi:hypothetical protein